MTSARAKHAEKEAQYQIATYRARLLTAFCEVCEHMRVEVPKYLTTVEHSQAHVRRHLCLCAHLSQRSTQI